MYMHSMINLIFMTVFSAVELVRTQELIPLDLSPAVLSPINSNTNAIFPTNSSFPVNTSATSSTYSSYVPYIPDNSVSEKQENSGKSLDIFTFRGTVYRTNNWNHDWMCNIFDWMFSFVSLE